MLSTRSVHTLRNLLGLYEPVRTRFLDIINKTKTKLGGKHFEWKDDDDDDDYADYDDDFFMSLNSKPTCDLLCL